MTTWTCRTIGCRRRRTRRFAVCSTCRFALDRELAR